MSTSMSTFTSSELSGLQKSTCRWRHSQTLEHKLDIYPSKRVMSAKAKATSPRSRRTLILSVRLNSPLDSIYNPDLPPIHQSPPVMQQHHLIARPTEEALLLAVRLSPSEARKERALILELMLG
ncbi:hypothetical protein EYF80_001535 [Liparis tanakae]|uniref:Uncharacterized protein n=1 Tax=Liparis tanakae TaxID=230148 RepID=A0A4Z2JDM2_9TELE|nr:hypothetical protein EYF80_001535 [Liparis tanakae]